MKHYRRSAAHDLTGIDPDFEYRGYWIRLNSRGTVWIEFGAKFVTYASSLADAKVQVDKRIAMLTPVTRKYRVAGCNFCDELVAKEIAMAPPHDASASCESGKYDHCSCDFCF